MLKRPHGGTRGVVNDAEEQSLSLDIRRRHADRQALRCRDQRRRRSSVLHSRMVRWVVSTTAAVLVFGPSPTLARAQSCPVDTVPRQELAEAMRTAREVHGDYDILATTNWVRFQSELFLRLVRGALKHNPNGGVLFIPAGYLFFEYLAVADLPLWEAEKAPIHRLWPYHYQQGTELDYRPDSIIRGVEQGPRPVLAVNVRVTWPDRPDGSRKYSFVDTLSVPKLKVTNHQVITFRFLDFGDMVGYDKIEGLSGRPLTGLLGVLFKMIGEGSVKYSRSSFSEDGLQVVRAKATKIFSKTATVTIYPDGRAEKDVPPDRPDLVELEERLKEDVDIEYYPYRCW